MDETRQVIHDESHARALLKGWLRRYKEESTIVLEQRWFGNSGSRSTAFKEIVTFIKAVIGDGMIIDFTRTRGFGKRKEYVAFSLEALELNQTTGNIELVLNVPICITVVDSKRPKDLSGTYKPFLLSEHLLCRVIQRTHCRSLSELASFFQPLILLLFEGQAMKRSQSENLICLFGDGYYATIYDEDQGMLVFKTWVSADRWTPKNEAKLSLLADKLNEGGLAVLISESEFERSPVLVPEDYLTNAIRIR
jgi:hypothetical protein